jgi:hypothetical protein
MVGDRAPNQQGPSAVRVRTLVPFAGDLGRGGGRVGRRAPPIGGCRTATVLARSKRPPD